MKITLCMLKGLALGFKEGVGRKGRISGLRMTPYVQMQVDTRIMNPGLGIRA